MIGVGYDAYCVIGRAPYEITLKNEGLMHNPNLDVGLKDLEGIKLEVAEERYVYYNADKKPSTDSVYNQKMAAMK